MTTYTPVDAASIDAVATFSDAGATVLIENVTVADIGVGLYEATSALTNGLYTLGQVYFLKITFTPVADVQRSQIIPFLFAPQSQASNWTGAVETACKDGTNLQPPSLSLRIGRGGHRIADFENSKLVDRLGRYEARFGLPADRTHKQIHFIVSTIRGGAPWSPSAVIFDVEVTSPYDVSGGVTV